VPILARSAPRARPQRLCWFRRSWVPLSLPPQGGRSNPWARNTPCARGRSQRRARAGGRGRFPLGGTVGPADLVCHENHAGTPGLPVRKPGRARRDK
jgi:hypothetical protein